MPLPVRLAVVIVPWMSVGGDDHVLHLACGERLLEVAVGDVRGSMPAAEEPLQAEDEEQPHDDVEYGELCLFVLIGIHDSSTSAIPGAARCVRGRAIGARCAVSPVHDRETARRKLSEEPGLRAREFQQPGQTPLRNRPVRVSHPDDSASFLDSLCPGRHRVTQFNLMTDAPQNKRSTDAEAERYG